MQAAPTCRGWFRVAGEADDQVDTVSGVAVPSSAVATCEELVALLREECRDLPVECEPGDFLVALERNATPEARP